MDIARILATKGDTAVTARPDQSIRDGLALLARHNIGALIVVDAAGAPIGILSQRDIVREAAGNEAVFTPRGGGPITRAAVPRPAPHRPPAGAPTAAGKTI